ALEVARTRLSEALDARLVALGVCSAADEAKASFLSEVLCRSQGLMAKNGEILEELAAKVRKEFSSRAEDLLAAIPLPLAQSRLELEIVSIRDAIFGAELEGRMAVLPEGLRQLVRDSIAGLMRECEDQRRKLNEKEQSRRLDGYCCPLHSCLGTSSFLRDSVASIHTFMYNQRKDGKNTEGCR
ncbi:unnamed protein product, partial [Polarella glacialis]